MNTEYALQMRKTADDFNAQAEIKKEEQHIAYIENKILPAITERAESGFYWVKHNVDSYHSPKRIATLLKSIGFTVENDCGRLIIRW